VERLAAYLAASGLPVWFDHEIISGHRWANVIREQIDTCGAVIVVMPPEADESDWVAREIAHADESGKPILPLLLKGRRFFSLANIQYKSVTGGEIPGPAFMARLRSLLELEPVPAEAVRLPRELVPEYARILGPDQTDTLRCRHNLAAYVGSSGNRTEAAHLLRTLVSDYLRVLWRRGCSWPWYLTTYESGGPIASGAGCRASRHAAQPARAEAVRRLAYGCVPAGSAPRARDLRCVATATVVTPTSNATTFGMISAQSDRTLPYATQMANPGRRTAK